MNEKRTAALLIVLTGTETGKTFPITGPVTIGRTNGNDVPVSDPSVSRTHARVEPVAGGFVVTDLGSRNKISAGGKTAATHKLSLGDEFTIGNVRLKLLQPARQQQQPEHAVIPVPPKVPVAVRAQVEAESLFEPPENEKKKSRKSVVVLGLITLIALVVYALAPATGPAITRIDVVVDEGMTKAVGIWDARAMIPRQSPVWVDDSKIASVSVATGNGFIMKVVGNSCGVTEASGTNRSGGKTIITVVVKARADDLWELRALPAAERKRVALYRTARARDIESHSPYEAMKEYGVAARILDDLEPRPKEYSEAVLSEKRLREQIDAQLEDYVKAYRLAVLASRHESAAAELRKISKLVPDTDDYRHQKAKLLYISLTKQGSRKGGK